MRRFTRRTSELMRLTKQYIDTLRGLKSISQVARELGMKIDHGRTTCPWHADQHPSLVCSDRRNTCHCFACGHTADPIELVMQVRGVGFREACEWLAADHVLPDPCEAQPAPRREYRQYPPDYAWLAELVRYPYLSDEAKHFLFDVRRLDPEVIRWCGISSINTPMPCYRGGRPFYDAPSLLIPYYSMDGRRVLSVQSRYLGPRRQQAVVGEGPHAGACDTREGHEVPRFRFPRGCKCSIWNLPILNLLQPGECCYITEGVTDALSVMSWGARGEADGGLRDAISDVAGIQGMGPRRKAIAIASATLLTQEDRQLLVGQAQERGIRFVDIPDNDPPGRRLAAQLQAILPNLVVHELPPGVKDVSEAYQLTAGLLRQKP